MKTIGYMDLVEKKIREYNPKDFFHLCQTRHDRIKEGLRELKHMGNIAVFLINGNKTRYLFRK